MGERTTIGWTDHTFNPWIGCQKASPGCKNCYAAQETFPRVQRYRGRELWGPAATTDRHVTSVSNWREPLKWNRRAAEEGTRRRVFCASMADVLEDHPAVESARLDLFGMVEETPYLDWLFLTKRPENAQLLPHRWMRDGFPSNVWMGTSVEDQQRADERIPHLLKLPVRVRFLSCEPLIGPLDLEQYFWRAEEVRPGLLHWVIVGGESGSGARPAHLEWIRGVVQQCVRAGAAPFVKQLGKSYWTEPDEDQPHRRVFSPDKKGEDWYEWPQDLRIREFPRVR